MVNGKGQVVSKCGFGARPKHLRTRGDSESRGADAVGPHGSQGGTQIQAMVLLSGAAHTEEVLFRETASPAVGLTLSGAEDEPMRFVPSTTPALSYTHTAPRTSHVTSERERAGSTVMSCNRKK